MSELVSGSETSSSQKSLEILIINWSNVRLNPPTSLSCYIVFVNSECLSSIT